MSGILILNKRSLHGYPYHAWLRDDPRPKVLLTARQIHEEYREDLAEFAPFYAHIEQFDAYNVNGDIELRALELHERFGFEQVLANFEFDLSRAARLRERLGLPGQTLPSATAFRDKVLMKDLCRARGLAVGDYRRVRTATDILEFVAAHGYPVVVKPANGGASLDTHVLRGDEELRALLGRGLVPRFDFVPNLIVERFVEGEMYHVDGLVIAGEVALVWPSRYINNTLSFKDDVALGSLTLDPGTPLTERLRAFTRAVLAALPTPPTTTFHAEIFHTPQDELVLCEVASRTGGAKVAAALELAFGVDINEAWYRVLCGLPVQRPAARPERAVGWHLIFPRPGELRAAPAACPLPGVVAYALLAQPGQRLAAAYHSTDTLASFVVEGADAAEVRARIASAERWFFDRLEIAAALS
jgi:biotin carboxylase